MKIRKVSRSTWRRERARYVEEARKLSLVTGHTAWTFLSAARCTCRYDHYNLPETFRTQYKPGVGSIQHFSDRPCTRLPMGIMVKCLASRRDATGTSYFIAEHAVGRCPFKTV